MKTPYINTNINNFCSPQRFSKTHVTHLNPDTNTILTSNLPVSNILNSDKVKQTVSRSVKTNIKDAYLNKNYQEENDSKQRMEKMVKMEKVKKMAKCRSQTAFKIARQQENQIKKQIEQIKTIQAQTYEKSIEIMKRRQDTTYLGRNIVLEGENYIKGMNEKNPAQKMVKVELTRLLMKQNTKKKSRQVISTQCFQDSAQSQTMLNTSINSSFINNSTDDLRINKALQNDKKDKILRQLIKNKSFDCLSKQLKRKASWNGFKEGWNLGFKAEEEKLKTIFKQNTKKLCKKKRQINYPSHQQDNRKEILQYNDKFSRQMSLKSYENLFKETASSFKIQAF